MGDPRPSSYNDRQRIAFLVGWDGWSDEIRQSIDHAIEARRLKDKDDETQCCLDCSAPLVPCDCRAGCTGGKCPECPLVEQGAARG